MNNFVLKSFYFIENNLLSVVDFEIAQKSQALLKVLRWPKAVLNKNPP